MTSPENQRYSIEQFAERENIEIVEWIEGIDESGSNSKSAWWSRLAYGCERIEAGAADRLVVWRIDRTSRNRLKWALTQDRVETAGGLILSSTEPNDQSPAGRFGRGVMVEHAIFMAEAIGATWKETLERRVRHGLSPNGARHYGYAYSKPDGYTVDPIEGPNLAAMYRSYIAGESAWQIAARYTDENAKPLPNGSYPRYARWNTASVLRLLDSGFGAGLILFRDELHEGVHTPVITADEWARFKHVRDERRRRPRAERSPYLYSGFIYCRCGGRMGGRTDHGRPRYTCTEATQYTRHEDASLAAHVVDDAILAWLEKIRHKLNRAATEAPRRPMLVANPARDISQQIDYEIGRLDAATTRFFDNPGVVSEESYKRYSATAEAKITALKRELASVEARATVRPVIVIGDLLDQWTTVPIERRREALRLLVTRITIHEPNAAERVVIDSPLNEQ